MPESPQSNEELAPLLRAIRRELVQARRPPIPSVPVQLRQRSVEQSIDHILGDARFDDAQIAPNKHEPLDAGMRAVTLDGLVAEFGVFDGTSLTRIARYFDTMVVHGFDSFIGLPESWSGTSKGAGAFDVGGVPPEIPVSNVEFHVGFFDTTVGPFESSHEGPFAFVHLDADLYSSTKTVFDTCFGWFVPGTVIVFDEYFGYHGWHKHEHRAFEEFLARSGLTFEALSIGHMNLAVRLLAA